MEFHVMLNEKLPIDNWSTTNFIPQSAIGSIPFYPLATNLDNGKKVLPAGEYKINVYDTHGIALTSSNEGDNTNQAVNIVDDLGNILLECNRVKGRCFRSMLNIYNQSGFKLGYVRKRLCKCKTEYEICTANQNVLFLLNFDCNTSEFGINITNCDGTHVIATVVLLGRLDDKLYLILTYLEQIAILQKTLILCAVIFCCEEEYKNNKNKNILCCSLFKESKIKFAILCVLCPILIGIYFIGILLFIVGFLMAFCHCIAYIFNNESEEREASKLVFVWPCFVCGLVDI